MTSFRFAISVTLLCALLSGTGRGDETVRDQTLDPRGDAGAVPAADLRRLSARLTEAGAVEVDLLTAGVLSAPDDVTYWLFLSDGTSKLPPGIPAALAEVSANATIAISARARVAPEPCGTRALPARIVTAQGEEPADFVTLSTRCMAFAARIEGTETYRDVQVPQTERLRFLIPEPHVPSSGRITIRAAATTTDRPSQADTTQEISIVIRR